MRNKKGKANKIWISVLVVFLGLTSAFFSTSDHSIQEPSENILEELVVHFIDVGQGDCTLITCGKEAMLIDAGDNDKGTKIQSYLQKQGIESLKYVICTHPDADHIGGMDVILYKFSCETILMTEEERETNTYRDVADTMKNKRYQKTLPVIGKSYSLGDAEFMIVGPVHMQEDSNNNSIAILLSHGENTFLFTGDAEEEEELDMVESGITLDADVYKAGHHGSRTSSSEKLLEAVSPDYAVISCGEGNSYGHPHSETLNHFRALGIKVFRTDEQGTIIAVSDGREITWNCTSSETWQAGEPVGSYGDHIAMSIQEPEDVTGLEITDAVTYICNTNSKKFHTLDCPSVEEMSDQNKLPTTLTREELIEQGYVPCKSCMP